MNFGNISTGIVSDAMVAEQSFIDTLPTPSDWIELPYGVSNGWMWSQAQGFLDDNGDPPPPEPTRIKYRTLLYGAEWVEQFTSDEWDWLKTRRDDETTAGKRLDQMMTSIRWLNAVDVASENLSEFYDWLVAQGIPGGQTRVDELRRGIPRSGGAS